MEFVPAKVQKISPGKDENSIPFLSDLFPAFVKNQMFSPTFFMTRDQIRQSSDQLFLEASDQNKYLIDVWYGTQIEVWSFSVAPDCIVFRDSYGE